MLFVVIGIAVSIALHEVGHLVPAKLFKVRVTKYMIGFGPTVWSRRRGETEYGLKAIPLVGYVSMIVMIDLNKEDGSVRTFKHRDVQSLPPMPAPLAMRKSATAITATTTMTEYRAPDGRRVRTWRNEDLDDYGQWDAAPSAAEEAQRSKVPGVSGGPRPYIQAVAPPQIPFSGPYAPGSLVIDTGGRKLYYVTSPTTAFAYRSASDDKASPGPARRKLRGIADWPDWYPPADMRERKPELPERMLGGIGNPLGAKAIYLGNTLYRIHGTNDPKSIGKAESSGCFRMMNENVLHLASLVKIGTEVTIVRSLHGKVVASTKAPPRTSSDRCIEQPDLERPHFDRKRTTAALGRSGLLRA